jgi:NAD+ synthetase
MRLRRASEPHERSRALRIALAQINPIVGDVAGNTRMIADAAADAHRRGAALVAFPEQAVLGYPAKDLLFRRELIDANVRALRKIAEQCRDIAVLVGFAEPTDRTAGRPIYNAAALLRDGRVAMKWRKQLLPTYDIFDEARYFQPAGAQADLFEMGGRRIGVTICEDIWSSQEMMDSRPIYDRDPVRTIADAGADLLINISASPFTDRKERVRHDLLVRNARQFKLPIAFVNQVGFKLPIAFVNQVGANDELVFDGASAFVDAGGVVRAQAVAFGPDMLMVDVDDPAASRKEKVPAGVAAIRAAAVLGIRDYVGKCGFARVIVGLSGGIDSAVVAALAAEALGPENVHGVAMPSRYSSGHSVEDARQLAENLGIRFDMIPIAPMHTAFETSVAELFVGTEPGLAEENMQARIRGALLMSLSNKFGALLLTTGNKSEIAVGYCTLYGDMCGALAVIGDVPKSRVYELARHINARSSPPAIPESTLTKPPSAELRPNQTDQDSLPDYETLDAILERHVEHQQDVEQIVSAGFDRAMVERVVRLVRISEYKRYQYAPVLKVTSLAFGSGRRVPIAARPNTD